MRTLLLAASILPFAGSACYRSEGDASPTPSRIVPLGPPSPARVDIVVMVDNSGSMAQEQAALAANITLLIDELVDPPDADGDGTPDHPPVDDLHVGVISSDMGVGGYTISTCVNRDVGDDGCFLHRSPPWMTECPDELPRFLSRDSTNAAIYPADLMARDFGCLATLGTSGCGFEQQLKAMQRAVTDNVRPGGCNDGFLRPDSVLVLIWVTDEEDCSVLPEHTEMFDASRPDLGHLSIRCFLHPDFRVPVPEILSSLRAVRSARPWDLVVGVIAGVPADFSSCIGRGDEIGGCLGDPRMTEAIDPAFPTQIISSCNSFMGYAFPPRRFVQLAQEFGASAWVDSICKEDWSGAMAGIGGRIVERLRHPCFEHELPFDAETCRTSCFAVETFSDDRTCEEDALCPSSGCPAAVPDDLPNLRRCRHPATGAVCEPLERDLGLHATEDGRMVRRCLVRQASRTAVGGGCSAPTDAGWFYVPPEAGSAEPACPEAWFTRAGGSLFAPGATAELICFE